MKRFVWPMVLLSLAGCASTGARDRAGNPIEPIYEVSEWQVRGCQPVSVLMGPRTEQIEKARVRGATHVVWARFDPNDPNGMVTGRAFDCGHR